MNNQAKLVRLLMLLLLAGVVHAGAQEVAVREPEGPRVVRVEVAARVLSDDGEDVELEPAPPGGVITLVEGQRARLRMVALRRNGVAAYPGTRFVVDGNRGTLNIVRANAELGSLVVVAKRPSAGGRPIVHFEILERLNIESDLRTGRIEIEVLPVERRPEPEPEPREVLGVTLFEHADFLGRRTHYTASVRNLQGSYVGNDATSSVRVAPGCRLVLYEHSDFRGNAAVLYQDVTHLGETRVGNDTLSSFELECTDPETRRGVALYDAEDFRGTEEIFYADDSDLRDNRIGDDRVRSLRLDRGCRVTLYELPGYRGRSMFVDQDFDSFRRSEIGADEVSSLRVDCR